MKTKPAVPLIVTFSVLVCASCDRSSSSNPGNDVKAQTGQPDEAKLSSDQAKRAFIKMIRSNGLLDDIPGALDAIQAAETKSTRDGYVDFGLWTFNPSKMTFAMAVTAPPLFLSYEGEFRLETGGWKAVITKERRN